MTMALFDYTMAPELIKGWLRKMKNYLDCNQPEVKEFHEQLEHI